MKNEIIENYITMTLNEIKQELTYYMKLNEEKIKETDEKMFKILNDLIDSRFNNLNVDKNLNLIYTFLPLNDKSENEKIRKLFTSYYTALYNDNVDLLHEMLKNDVKFYKNYCPRLEFLDKDLTSKFSNDEYIRIVKEKDDILIMFIRSINMLEDEGKNKYIDRFINILNLRYDDLENDSFCLTKKALDMFTDEAYLNASKKQLEFISRIGSQKISLSNENKNRLNNLIINSDYCNPLCDMNLMLKIFTDEELKELSYSSSEIISYYSDSKEMLNKAIDLIKKHSDVRLYRCEISKELFMKINNDVLYEIYNNFILSKMDDSAILAAAKLYTPKAKIKSIVRRKNK